MATMKRDGSDLALRPALVYATAATCGVLAALAVQIQLSHSGFDFAAFWQNLSSPRGMQLRSAGPWWAVAGAAFVISGGVAAALSRMPLPWRRFRLLRWLAGAAIVLVLAQVGQDSAELPEHAAPAAHVLATLGALVLTALMSLGGAYLTIRR